MKINRSIKKFIPIITFIPLLLVLFLREDYNILILNQLTNGLFTRITFTAISLYALSMIYRTIYSEQNMKKLISPLSFIFISYMIHQMLLFISIIPIISIINMELTSNIIACYLISILILLIQTYFFEITSYNQSSNKPLSSILEKSQNNSTVLEILTTLVLLFSIVSTGITDTKVLIDFVPLFTLLLWNLLFIRIVRPQLFTYLKDE